MTKLDFWKKVIDLEIFAKMFPNEPKIRHFDIWLVGWLVRNAVFSKTALKIFLIFKLGDCKDRKLTERDFWKKLLIWRYSLNPLEICSKIAQVEVVGHFLDFASLVFHDFTHYDRWAWCLVIFLQFASPVNVFLLSYKSW